MPSLQEYIAICRKYDKQSILELKAEFPEHKIVQMVELIKSMGWLDRTTFISFYGENLVLLKKAFPQADAQFLAMKCGEEELAFMEKHALDADLFHRAITKELVETLHAKGLKVNCWTVDDLETAARMRDCGVDFITSNILE